MSYDNTNRGAIWKNERKDSEKHPDFTGSLDVDGVEYFVSAWKRPKDASAKSPALSFRIRPKEEAKPRREESQKKEFDDDLPF